MQRKALIIEDNPEIARLVQMRLGDIGCTADIAPDGDRGLSRYRNGRYHLVVLDLMLPDMDGLEVCRKLRALPGYVPILMLTARSTELDRVLGLETGADDYLTKPFSVLELLARAKALFRRARAMSASAPGAAASGGQQEVLQHGGLHIDVGRRLVRVEGREVPLTAKEFELLLHFAQHPGRVYSRAQLLDQVWGYSHEGYEHTVNSHINRLRGKIERDPAKPRYIVTVWGVGYKLAGD